MHGLLTVRIQQLQPVLNSIARPDAVDFLKKRSLFNSPSVKFSSFPFYLIFFNERYERRPLYFYWLPRPVVEGCDEMEEVGLAQVGRRLLLKVSAADARSNSASWRERERLR